MEKKIENAVVSEIDRNKQHIRDLDTFLVKKYKNAGGRKRTSYDDDDFGIGDDDESEGYELDFLWNLLKNSDRKVSLNPKTVYDWAKLFDKKSSDNYWNWVNPIKVELFTGFYAEPYKQVTIKPEMVDYIEMYEHDIKTSSLQLETIANYLQKKSIHIHKLNYDEWVYEIANYYFENKNTIQYSKILSSAMVFRPLDNDKITPFYELKHYRIEPKEILKIIEELNTIEKNIKNTKKILTKILKENSITTKEATNLNYHQYLYIISMYYLNHQDEFSNDYVFHPMTIKENHKIQYDIIQMENILKFGDYIKLSKNDLYLTELNKIKIWGSIDGRIDDWTSMNEQDWKELIKNYHEENKIEILESTIYFPVSKKIKPYSLNHYIIDSEDLNEGFNILDLMDLDSDDDDFLDL